MNNIIILYRASQSLQKKLFAQGLPSSKLQILELNAPELLKFAHVDEKGIARINLFEDSFDFRKQHGYAPLNNFKKWSIVVVGKEYFEHNVRKYQAEIQESEITSFWFDVVPDAKQLLALFTKKKPDLKKELVARQAELDADFEKRKAEYLARKAESEAREKLRTKEKAEDEAKIEAEQKERAVWIEKNGSDRLKKMLQHGYELRATYEEERAEIEFPDFIFDTDEIQYKNRANPSLEGLQQLEQFADHKPKIVWITGDETCDPDYPFDCYEAIRISPDWSRYNLLKTI